MTADPIRDTKQKPVGGSHKIRPLIRTVPKFRICPRTPKTEAPAAARPAADSRGPRPKAFAGAGILPNRPLCNQAFEFPPARKTPAPQAAAAAAGRAPSPVSDASFRRPEKCRLWLPKTFPLSKRRRVGLIFLLGKVLKTTFLTVLDKVLKIKGVVF